MTGIRPQAKQELFLKSNADIAVFGGSAGAALGALEISGVWNRLNVEAFEAMAGLTAAGTPLYALLEADYGLFVEGVVQSLTRGIALGEPPLRVAEDMMRASGMGLERATTIARTEINRAFRTANIEQYRQSGVVVGFRRLVYKPTACLACLMMDGDFYTLEQELSDHPNGRCCAVPCLSKDDVIDWQTGKEWLLEQDPERQRAIMGAGRYELWKEGKIRNPSDMVYMKHNPVWGGAPAVKTLKQIEDELPKLFLPKWEPYEVAKSGGKNYNFYFQYSLLPNKTIYQGIQAFEKNINEHKNRIADFEKRINHPSSYVVNMKEALGLLRYWKREIILYLEQKDILKGIIRAGKRVRNERFSTMGFVT